jgi:hypothetical protein
MYLVGRNFYSRFLPEARAVAGEQAAALVDAHIDGADGHAWLARTGEGNPILGWMPPPPPEPEASPETAPTAAEEPAPGAAPDMDGGSAATATDTTVTTAAADAGEGAAEEGTP